MGTGSAANEMTTGVEADATCATWNCDRPAATGYTTCCRTCIYSEGTGHGSICQKAFEGAEKTAAWEKTQEDNAEGSAEEEEKKERKEDHPNEDKEAESAKSESDGCGGFGELGP